MGEEVAYACDVSTQEKVRAMLEQAKRDDKARVVKTMETIRNGRGKFHVAHGTPDSEPIVLWEEEDTGLIYYPEP